MGGGLSDDTFVILMLVMTGVAMLTFTGVFFYLYKRDNKRIQNRSFANTLALSWLRSSCSP